MRQERFLKRNEVAAMLGTTPALAASCLAKRGVHPVDLGVGRSRGLRWLESAVAQAMRDMATEAAARHAPRPKKQRPATNAAVNIADMSAREIEALVKGKPAPSPGLTASPRVQ